MKTWFKGIFCFQSSSLLDCISEAAGSDSHYWSNDRLQLRYRRKSPPLKGAWLISSSLCGGEFLGGAV
jgi:hypothetical protein